MSSYRNVVCVGYPKSGTTWLTRLTAELIGCPVEGFWGEPENDGSPTKEGKDRTSEFRCYKAHHQLKDLADASEKSFESVISIVRDPRDLVISGGHYFPTYRFGTLGRKMGKNLPHLPEFLDGFKEYLKSFIYDWEEMIQAVLQEDSDIGVSWLKPSWEEYVRPYVESPHLVVRYEDLLENPKKECKNILQHIGLERDEGEIKRAIRNQSFSRKKKELEKRELYNGGVMRSGKHGQWKNILSKEQKKRITDELYQTLSYFGYL